MTDEQEKLENEEKVVKAKKKSGMTPAVVMLVLVFLAHFFVLKNSMGKLTEGIKVAYFLPIVTAAAVGGIGSGIGTAIFSLIIFVTIISSKSGVAAAFEGGSLIQILVMIAVAIIVGLIKDSSAKKGQGKIEDMDVENKKLQAQLNKAKVVEEELRKESQRIAKMSSRIVAIQTLTQVIGKSLDEGGTLREILNVSQKVFGAKQMAILVLDPRTRTLAVKVHIGLKEAEANSLRIRLGEGIPGYVAQTGELVTSNEIKKDYKLSDLSKKSAVQSIMCAPLSSADNIVGVINIMALEDDRQPTSEDSRMLSLLATLATMSMENARLHQETVKLANVDGLTKLYNNRYFQGFLDKEMARSNNVNGKVSIFMTDIDHFKSFNDTHGHQIGDFVLEQTAAVVAESIREGDLAARYGGEEFIVVMPGSDTREAFIQAEHVRKTIMGKTYREGNLNLNVTVSIGVATYPTHTRDKAELIRYADEGLYLAKQGGRNCTKIAFEEKRSALAAEPTPSGPVPTPLPSVAPAPPPPGPGAPGRVRKYVKKIIKTRDGQIKQIVKIPVDEHGKQVGPPIQIDNKPSSGDEVLN